jgi:hypothetical protein
MTLCSRLSPLWAALLAAASPAVAQTAPDLLNRLEISGLVDLRVALSDGQETFRHGGYGPLRFGEQDSAWTPHAMIGDAHLIWHPVKGALRLHVDGRYQPGQDRSFGLNEVWLAWKPVPRGRSRLSARTGLFYPPVSLENDGPGWTTTRTITPSAINSWIGEEVKPLSAEARFESGIGDHELALTAAIFSRSDTAGTLLAFRGWAFHDLMTAAWQDRSLPPMSAFAKRRQAPFTTPIYELDDRPGYYVRGDWQLPDRLALDIFWYDNRGNKTALDKNDQWAWDTRFLDIGARYDFDDKTQLLAQYMGGRGQMGFKYQGNIWFDIDFRSAYLLASRRAGSGYVAARVDWLRIRDRTQQSIDNNEEHGWALTADYRRPLNDWATLLFEVLHVRTDRPGNIYGGVAPIQHQTQLQAAFRASF